MHPASRGWPDHGLLRTPGRRLHLPVLDPLGGRLRQGWHLLEECRIGLLDRASERIRLSKYFDGPTGPPCYNGGGLIGTDAREGDPLTELRCGGQSGRLPDEIGQAGERRPLRRVPQLQPPRPRHRRSGGHHAAARRLSGLSRSMVPGSRRIVARGPGARPGPLPLGGRAARTRRDGLLAAARAVSSVGSSGPYTRLPGHPGGSAGYRGPGARLSRSEYLGRSTLGLRARRGPARQGGAGRAGRAVGRARRTAPRHLPLSRTSPVPRGGCRVLLRSRGLHGHAARAHRRRVAARSRWCVWVGEVLGGPSRARAGPSPRGGRRTGLGRRGNAARPRSDRVAGVRGAAARARCRRLRLHRPEFDAAPSNSPKAT